MEHSDHWIMTGWRGEQWDFQNNGTFWSLDHDWVAWRTVGFSEQWKDNGTFWSLDHDWMTCRTVRFIWIMKWQWNIRITRSWLDGMENSEIFKTMKRQCNILITGSWLDGIGEQWDFQNEKTMEHFDNSIVSRWHYCYVKFCANAAALVRTARDNIGYDISDRIKHFVCVYLGSRLLWPTFFLVRSILANKTLTLIDLEKTKPTKIQRIPSTNILTLVCCGLNKLLMALF